MPRQQFRLIVNASITGRAQELPLRMSKTYDAILIGGGIMGCSSAYQLAQRGLRVAIVEKNLIGEGPTGSSSAILRTHYSNALTTRMAAYGLEVYGDFRNRVGDDCGFHRTGFLLLAPEGDLAGLQASLELQRSLGITSELLSPEALDEILPGIDTEGVAGAAWEPASGYADAYLAVTAYARAARRLGADVLQETEVTDVRLVADRVTGVETTQGFLEAPLVVNSAGAWGSRIAAMVDIEIPVNACRVQVAFFRQPGTAETRMPVVADFLNACYFRPEVGNLTLAGVIDPAEAEAIVDPDLYAKSVDYSFQATVGEKLCRRLPAMAESAAEGGYASLYAVTPDWHPIVDELIPDSGFYVCTGFSGHGFKLGPAVGVMVADLLTGEDQPEFDPDLFSLDRFAKQEPVQGGYKHSIVG